MFHAVENPDFPMFSAFSPLVTMSQDLSLRIPAATLCNDIRALGNPLKTKSFQIKADKQTLFITSIMLIMCGDIESNPGPNVNNIYPCGICDLKVSWLDKGVACDNCGIWFHCSCISMKSSQYSQLNSTSEHWYCFRCNTTNSNNSLYHSYNIEVTNSFSILAGAVFNEDSVSSHSPSPFQPMAHSSPQVSHVTPALNASAHSSPPGQPLECSTHSSSFILNKTKNI